MVRRNSCSRCHCDPCKCHRDTCCEPDPCLRVKSSEVVYDGGNISELGIKNGMSLNDVITRISSSITNVYGDTRVLKIANFKGTSRVIIGDMETAEMVFYCGNKVPTNLYSVLNNTVVFKNQLINFDDADAEVSVLYRGKVSLI